MSRDHLFDCEYWELEQRKLRLKKSVPGPLQGHVAIVTGGCSGIGLSTAELYVQSGACVVVVDIRQDRVESAVKHLKALAGGQSVVLGLCADVTDETAMCKVVDSAVQYFGGVDILVSNAGVVVQSSPGMASCARNVLEKSMNINFFSHQWITSAVVRTYFNLFSRNINGQLTSSSWFSKPRHDDCTEYRRLLALQCLESTLESWCKTWTVLYRKSCHISSDATVRNRVRKVRYSC